MRLAGIDAPEREQPFGAWFRRLVLELTEGSAVRVREEGRDPYGRVLAEVFLADGSGLNRELVRRGAAWWFRRYAPDDAELAALEAQVRTWVGDGGHTPNPSRRGSGGAGSGPGGPPRALPGRG